MVDAHEPPGGPARSGLLSRRNLLRGAGAAVFLGGSAAVLPSFGISGARQNPKTCRASDLSATQRELIISNWPEYIDPPPKHGTSTLQDFEAKTGITVHYTEDVSDNNEFFAKIVNQMGSCQTIGRDLMVLTDWMAARCIDLGWIQKLDAARVPNVHANLLQRLQHPQWDPHRDYSAPWQTGVTGIAYNSSLTGEVKSFKELLTRSDLKGRITLLTEMRDTMMFMLLLAGAEPEHFSDDQWSDAIDLLRSAVSRGQVRAFTGNEYVNDLLAGNIAACEAWSGDVIQAQYKNKHIKFVVPEEGLSLWSDNMLIPNLSRHERNAEAWMNYYYDPQVAAKLAAWVNYICPVQGAQQAMEKIDKSLVDNPLIFPDAEFLKNAHALMPLSESKMRQYDAQWSDVTGS